MREDPLGRGSMFDGLRYSDGNEQQIWDLEAQCVCGGGGGVNHVKKNKFLDFRTERNDIDIDEGMCYVSLISYWSWVAEDFGAE